MPVRILRENRDCLLTGLVCPDRHRSSSATTLSQVERINAQRRTGELFFKGEMLELIDMYVKAQSGERELDHHRPQNGLDPPLGSAAIFQGRLITYAAR